MGPWVVVAILLCPPRLSLNLCKVSQSSCMAQVILSPLGMGGKVTSPSWKLCGEEVLKYLSNRFSPPAPPCVLFEYTE